MRIRVNASTQIDALFKEEVALLYKHSPACFASASALREIEALVDSRPELPVYQVDVIENRSLSQEAERRLGIRHESPQVILLRTGNPVWHTSHYHIKVSAITRKLDVLRSAQEDAA